MNHQTGTIELRKQSLRKNDSILLSPVVGIRARGVCNCVLCILVFLVCAAVADGQEPSYKGRALSEWFRGWRIGQIYFPDPSEEAILGLGTNAIPKLLEWISFQRLPEKGLGVVETTNFPAKPANIKESGPIVYVPASPGITITFITDSNKEPSYRSLPLGLWIQTNTSINPRKFNLVELLSLKQVSAPDDWGTVWFELPIAYDALTARGELDLGWLNKNGEYVECCFEGVKCGTNGLCRLWWASTFDPPGAHRLRARLTLWNGWDNIQVIGPPLVVFSSNACWFLEGSTLFSHTGATINAQLYEKTATYKIVLKTVKGRHIRTFKGSTTNGVIDLEWDLRDKWGRKFKEGSFHGWFYIRYPGDKHYRQPAKAWFNRIGG